MKEYFSNIVILLVISVFFTSCHKQERQDLQTTAVDNIMAESMFADALNQVYIGYHTAMYTPLPGNCPSETFDSSSTWPRTLTIDFGYQCNDGINSDIRGGKIIANFSGEYADTGTVIYITFEDYFKNSVQIIGSARLTNKGYNSAGHLNFALEVHNAKVIKPNGTVIWNVSRDIEWIEGENTPWPTFQDDAYQITGTTTGKNITNQPYTVNISSPIKVELDCRWLISGILEITPEGGIMGTLDFGDCNDKATLKYKKKTLEIYVP